MKIDAVLGPPRADRDGGIVRRESDGVGEQIIEHLHHAPLVADEVADIGIDVDLELDAVGRQPVLDAFGGGLDGLAILTGPSSSFMAPASMVARSRMLLVIASSALVDLVM